MAEIKLLNNRYKKGRLLGQGGFGSIYKALDTLNNKDVAIKEGSLYEGTLQLESEIDFYKVIKIERGFLRMLDHFRENRRQYMVITLVGDSVETLLHTCHRKLELKTTLMIAMQLIERVECLHRKGILHRDIKPDNMAMGINPDDKHILYLLDLGIGKQFKYDNYHISQDYGKSLRGTTRYASINSHEGLELSRRDDLESVAYVLIYLQKGNLPWQGLKSDTREYKCDKVYRRKNSFSPEILCAGLEPEFLKLLEYARGMAFIQKPDYRRIKGWFEDLFKRKDFEDDGVFQWTLPSDPAFIAKKKKLDLAKRAEEELKRQNAIKQKQKKLKRKRFNMAPSKSDLFFSPHLPLEQRRAIVYKSMLDDKFPSMLPTLFPPTKKQKSSQNASVHSSAFPSTNLVLGCTIDGTLIHIGHKLLPEKILNEAELHDHAKASEAVIKSKNLVLGCTIDGVLINLEHKPLPENIVDEAELDAHAKASEAAVKPTEGVILPPLFSTTKKPEFSQNASVCDIPFPSTNLVFGCTIDGVLINLGHKLLHEKLINEAELDNHAKPSKVVVKSMEGATQAVVPTVPIQKKANVAPVLKPTKKKAKKRKVPPVEDTEPPRKTRKQQQAEVLQMVRDQVHAEQMRCEEDRLKKHQAYLQRRNAQYEAFSPYTSSPPAHLPPFQQYQNPYQPAVIFKSIFGGGELKPTCLSALEEDSVLLF